MSVLRNLLIPKLIECVSGVIIEYGGGIGGVGGGKGHTLHAVYPECRSPIGKKIVLEIKMHLVGGIGGVSPRFSRNYLTLI